MNTLGQPIHGPLSGREARLAPWWPPVDGVLLGGIAGIAAIAAMFLAPWWLVVIAGFLASPVLLVTSLAGPSGEVIASGAVVLGSVLLYVGYAEVLAYCCRREVTRSAWIVAVLLVHMACLIAWMGLFLSDVVAGLYF
jgi:hypothetical protein